MNKRVAYVVVTCTLVGLLAASVRAESNSYFRRAGGVAANDGEPLPENLASKDNLVWRQPLAPGHSTPCVFGDSVFLTTFVKEKKNLATVALDRATGKVKWTRVVPTKKIEPIHPTGSPAASTVACDGQRLYVFFGSCGLLCYDLKGKLLWKKRMGPFQDQFGAASSPILVDGKVVLNEDHDIGSFLIAVDQKTGKTVWRVERKEATRSYSTPVVWDVPDTELGRSVYWENALRRYKAAGGHALSGGGKKQIVVAGALKLVAYDPKDGRELWRVRGLSRIVDTTPVIAQGLLYAATWTPGGDLTERIAMDPFPAALKKFDKNDDSQIAEAELPKGGAVQQRFFRIDLNQDGKLNEKEWKKQARVFELAQNVAIAVRPGGRGDVTDTHVKVIHRRGLPVVPSPVVYRGVFYMVKSGILTSVSVADGKQLKRARLKGQGYYYASLVAGDGKVYAASRNGVVTVIRHGKQFEVVSSHNFKEEIKATPVIADGQLFVRTDNALYCFCK